jgi:UDP-N-acetylmuramate: L-alanyl-gamma-D-glutamyl-meso-diaminopimelate ligase
MRIYILGICGTFMGSLAILAKQLGHIVSGCDQQVYPPMSTQLQAQGITLNEGYDPTHLTAFKPDHVVIGNACSRGNPAVEFVLESRLMFSSGPAWLAQNVLREQWVLGVAGTHGKTTTSSMLAWILEYAEMKPGYLIGGIPGNFEVSARLGEGQFFVIEADEYDSAFFDKRSKFIHYQSRTLVLGNLEFDHADIFRSLEDIEIQFHHLIRTIPRNGRILTPWHDSNLRRVLERGYWSELAWLEAQDQPGGRWNSRPLNAEGSQIELSCDGEVGTISWSLIGAHNRANALAAAAAAEHVGVPLAISAQALATFKGVKRRLELLGEVRGVKVFDDFAHHPTAILSTLEGLRAAVPKDQARVVAVLEARSNTMRMGYYQQTLAEALSPADVVFWYQPPESTLDLEVIRAGFKGHFIAAASVDEIIHQLSANVCPGDHVVIMSNGGFGNIHQRLLKVLEVGN